MTLAAGTRLGPYEILAPLGAGGMGEVYRARDSRLGREVAVKVLPAAVAKDRDRVARFEQEARAASALNHPHIVTIHDIGLSDDTVYIAMELVDGETLGKMTAAGPIPVRRLLAVAAQVAEGLAKAHSAGIVHRDLKPENVMVTSDGFVKILDFGLAKLVADSSDSQSGLPTAGPPQTHPGTVLGTVGYMSPEQAAGLPLDFRTDQFSFGSIVYEMATGKRAFQRATTVDTLAAILHEEPEPIARVSPTVPAPLRWIVDRCLEKDPKARYASTLDLARELGSVRDHVSELSGGASALSAETRHRFHPRFLAAGLAAAALLVGLAAGYLLWGRGRPSAPASKVVLNLALPPDQRVILSSFPSLAISADGSRVAYVGASGSATALYVRTLDSLDAKLLPGTEGAINPFFSPDGSWVGFGAGGKLKKISVAGGQPLTICDAPILRGASWGTDGTILFAPISTGGLSRVSENGGEPKTVTTLDRAKGEATHRWPQILAGGKAAIFTANDLTGNYDRARIEAISLESGERRTVLKSGTDARLLGSGHLLYTRGDSLYAVGFDAGRLRAIGSPVPVLDGVAGSPPAGFAHAALSSSGDLVYLPRDPLARERDLVRIDRNGAVRALTDVRRYYGEPRLSPDGRRLAATVLGTGPDIWICDLDRNAWEQLTSDGYSYSGVWSPDGKQIAFASNRAGPVNMFVASTDRSVPPRQLTSVETWPSPLSWAPDGRTLLATENAPGGGGNLVEFSFDGKGDLKRLLPLPAANMNARIAPDGAWMVYESNESGRFEIYLTRYPNPSGRTQVSTQGGTQPAWSGDGREVFFRSGKTLMAASVQLTPEPRAGVPRALFETEFEEFDPAPDGRSFVAVRRAHPNLPQKPLAVVLGFADEVARLAAAKK